VEEQFWDLAAPTSTLASVRLASLGWLTRNAKLALHGDVGVELEKNASGPVGKTEPGLYLCNYAVSLVCTADSVIRNMLDNGRW